MTAGQATYPRRRPFFANRFCRLMTKVCLANQVGPEACFLLMTIAMTEDAKSYRGAVTFWNEQLIPLVGVNSVKSLIRIRNKAIEAGWLHYEQGGKGVVGRYWVEVPKEYEGMDDVPVDENVAEYQSVSHAKNDTTSAGEVEGEVQGKRHGKGSTSGNHSSLTPVLTQDKKESPTVSGADAPPADAPKAKTQRKEPTGPHADARRAFCSRWQAKYGAEYKFEFGKHGKMLTSMLAFLKDDVPKLLTIFDRFFADSDQFYAVDSRHDFARLSQHFNRWAVDAPPATGPPARPAGGFKTKQQQQSDTYARLADFLEDSERAALNAPGDQP